MPIVTTAVLAVSAAIAMTTVATVAAAAVAVSAVIGVAGLAVSAVGMVTKNKGLLQAGKIMGYVGMAGGLAGMGVGMMDAGVEGFTAQMGELYAQGSEQGLGSFFGGGADAAAGSVQPEALNAGAEAVDTGITPGINASAPSTSLTEPAQDVGQAAVQENLGDQIVKTTQGNMGASQGMAGIDPAATPVTPQAAAPPVATAENDLAAQTMAANPGQSLMQGPAPLGASEGGSSAGANFGNGIGGAAGNGVTPPTAGANMTDWFKNLPPSMQASLAMTAGQGLSGAAGGLFAGMSAEQKLDLEKVINDQRQAQVQYQNKNAAYAPKLRFNGPTQAAGLMSTRRT